MSKQQECYGWGAWPGPHFGKVGGVVELVGGEEVGFLELVHVLHCLQKVVDVRHLHKLLFRVLVDVCDGVGRNLVDAAADDCAVLGLMGYMRRWRGTECRCMYGEERAEPAR